MLRLAARPNTVRAWTGFSRQRVRQILRQYRQNPADRTLRCNRGPSPKKLTSLLANPNLRSEITAMAGLCQVLHLIPADPMPNARLRLPSLFMGERLCHAFETYRAMVPYARLTLEQVILVVFALAEGNEWRLERCAGCRAVMFVDLLSIARRVCTGCRALPAAAELVNEPIASSEMQQRLF